MAEAEEAFVWRLRERWPDADLADHCRDFIADYFAFWQRHSRILHLRNAMADTHDRRMMEHRIAFATPIIALLVGQMDRRARRRRIPGRVDGIDADDRDRAFGDDLVRQGIARITSTDWTWATMRPFPPAGRPPAGTRHPGWPGGGEQSAPYGRMIQPPSM